MNEKYMLFRLSLFREIGRSIAMISTRNQARVNLMAAQWFNHYATASLEQIFANCFKIFTKN